MDGRIFDVGAGKEWTSLSELLIALKDDESEKTIRLFPGVYDIYEDYRRLKMETPPDDIPAGDYLERCVFLPKNTKLLGVNEDGSPDVCAQGQRPVAVLLWNPKKEEITKGEARVWSPLNVRYACEVENITIDCHFGRYCIHDDSHNHVTDRGVAHIYRNVHCIYHFSEDGIGFNNTIGFGFSQQNNYLFENCVFEMVDCPEDSLHHSAFYGHAASGRELVAEDGPTILVKNCRILGSAENNRTVRLQCLNRCPLHVKARFEDCEIEGGVNLNLYYEDAEHAYDVELVNSGAPPLLVD